MQSIILFYERIPSGMKTKNQGKLKRSLSSNSSRSPTKKNNSQAYVHVSWLKAQFSLNNRYPHVDQAYKNVGRGENLFFKYFPSVFSGSA